MKRIRVLLVVGICVLSCAAFAENSAFGAGPDADFNNDNQVDDLDLVEWNNSFGMPGGADADGNGASEGFDFLAWQSQLGNATPAQAGLANPEPATLIVWSTLAAVAGLGVVSRRRRQRAAAGDSASHS